MLTWEELPNEEKFKVALAKYLEYNAMLQAKDYTDTKIFERLIVSFYYWENLAIEYMPSSFYAC